MPLGRAPDALPTEYVLIRFEAGEADAAPAEPGDEPRRLAIFLRGSRYERRRDALAVALRAYAEDLRPEGNHAAGD